MVLADRRFLKKRAQLPRWINQALLDADTNLSTDMAISSAKKFLKTIAQPFKAKDQEGISTWDLADLQRHKEKVEEEKIRELQNSTTVDGSRVTSERDVAMEDEFGMDDEELEACMMELDEP